MEWENIFANHISEKGLISKIYLGTHMTQQQRKQITQLKNSKEPEQTFLQRRYTGDQQAYEEVLNITNHWGNANPKPQ